jgi:hypothetical protein
MRCEEMRELAADVALDTVSGEERGEALRHLATCTECRRLVDQLSEVADELYTLSPPQEPPAGFESRALERMGLAGAPRRRRWRGLALRIAAPVATAAAAAGIMVGVYHDDHQLADRYRGTLEEANGKYFSAGKLRDPAGARAGTAFAYQGKPSWVFVVVDRAHRRQAATGEVVTRDGRRIALHGFRLRPDGTWGGGIPVDVHDVATIRLLGSRPGQVLEATRRDEE